MTLSQISCTKVSSLQVSCQLLLTHDSLVLHLLQQQIRKTMKVVVPKQPVMTSGSLRPFCPQKQNLEILVLNSIQLISSLYFK